MSSYSLKAFSFFFFKEYTLKQIKQNLKELMKSKYLQSFIKHTPCFFCSVFHYQQFRTFLNTSWFNCLSVLPPRSQVIGQLGRIRFFGDDLYDLFSGRRKPRYDQVNVQFLIIIWPKLEQDLDISIDLQANLMRLTWF